MTTPAMQSGHVDLSRTVSLDQLPGLEEGAVHVWAGLLSQWQQHVNDLRALCSVEELQRAGRFRHERDRARHIVGRSILRLLTARYLRLSPTRIDVRLGPHGKPSVSVSSRRSKLDRNQQTSTPLQTLPHSARVPFGVNISHSGDWILWAVGFSPNIGVDVEQRRTDFDIDDLAPSVFSDWEQRALGTFTPADQRQLFFDLWTRKEAVIKADGAGVQFGLQRFDVEFRPEYRPCVRAIRGDGDHRKADPANWTLSSVQIDAKHAAALACHGQHQVIGGTLVPEEE